MESTPLPLGAVLALAAINAAAIVIAFFSASLLFNRAICFTPLFALTTISYQVILDVISLA
jgi:hypothetical protein